MNDALAEIDRIAPGPVLVVGSLPPGARDLDLVVPDDDVEPLAARLVDAGYVRCDRRFARFGGTQRVALVELTSVGHLGLSGTEGDAVLGDARAVEGHERVRRPAPHHVVLLLARQRVRYDAPLTDKRRRRLAAAADEDAGCWDIATSRASAWGLPTHAIAALRRDGAGIGDGLLTARSRRTPRSLAARARRGAVITLSGLDGSGKSSQATLLRDTLEELGHDSVVVWTRLGSDAALDAIARPVKAVVRRARRRSDPSRSTSRGPSALRVDEPPDDARDLRRNSRALTYTWSIVVAALNLVRQWRAIAPHLAAGRVVVCDRFVLDSRVHLRYRYGSAGPLRLQLAMLRALAPRARASFFLDVDGSVALARKAEQYDRDHLERHATLYREEAARLDVHVLDGTRTPDELATEIARTAWVSLC